MWYPDEYSLIFMRPNLENSRILVNVYLLVKFDLSIKAFCKNETFPLSLSCLSDIRHLESVQNELSFSPHHCQSSKKSDSTTAIHVYSAKAHIQQAIDIIHTISDLETSESPELNLLQLIQCQLENCLVPKYRRRYNILTQILSLKTHLISLACYKYLQHMSCISFLTSILWKNCILLLGSKTNSSHSLGKQRIPFLLNKSMLFSI